MTRDGREAFTYAAVIDVSDIDGWMKLSLESWLGYWYGWWDGLIIMNIIMIMIV
jgi:hypothetical protein